MATTRKTTFEVVRMRPCYGRQTGKFVSLIVYNYHDENAETEVKFKQGKLFISFDESEETDAEKEEKKKLQKSRFLYPDHPDFGKVVEWGKTKEMLPENFTV